MVCIRREGYGRSEIESEGRVLADRGEPRVRRASGRRHRRAGVASIATVSGEAVTCE